MGSAGIGVGGEEIEPMLRAAFLTGSADETRRAGLRAGARLLVAALNGRDRTLVLAAAAAAPGADDAVWLLPPLAARARTGDRPLAVAAARAAAAIASATDREAVLDMELPPDWVRARIRDLRMLSADPGRWLDVRVYAMDAAAALTRALGSDARPADAPYDLAAAAADPDPEIRRAALELLPGPLGPDALAIAAALVAGDPDPVVAGAAAQAMCEGLALGDPPRPVLTALGPGGVDRLRTMSADAAVPPAARHAADRCLAADLSAGGRPGPRRPAPASARGRRR